MDLICQFGLQISPYLSLKVQFGKNLSLVSSESVQVQKQYWVRKNKEILGLQIFLCSKQLGVRNKILSSKKSFVRKKIKV